MMSVFKVTSCQAPNADPLIERISTYLGERLGIPTEFVNDIPWQERERRLDAGEIQVGWICGLPYVWKFDQKLADIEPLAAPVMAAPRYQGRPVYFSDVIVHRDSPFKSFSDLRGATWAYNEPRSHSGYNLTRYQLATLGEKAGFFGRAVEAQAHEIALRLVLRRSIDASAIDSTVLETELHRDPDLADRIRVLETWGPSPIPPFVIHRAIPETLRREVQGALLSMHEHPGGREILAEGRLARFVQVKDRDYDLIREMDRLARSVTL